jgi:ketosteroid isomerase-like protein
MISRGFGWIALAVLLGGSCVAPVMADATANAKKEIQSLYDKMDAAAAKKDIKGMTASLDPNYMAVSAKGQKMTLQQMRGQMTQIMTMLKELKTKTVIQKLTLKGKTATVNTKQTLTSKGMNPQSQQTMKIEVQDTSTNTWVKSGTTWKLKETKSLATKQFLNGKPVQLPDGGR